MVYMTTIWTAMQKFSGKKPLPKIISNLYQINNSFYKHSYNQNIKQNINAETRDDFIFQKSNKNKGFNGVKHLSQLNENVLCSNRSGQLTVEDDVKETVNVETVWWKPSKNPTRTTTKKSCVSESDLNSNNCNRPSTNVNNQTYIKTHKRPTTVVNRRPGN